MIHLDTSIALGTLAHAVIMVIVIFACFKTLMKHLGRIERKLDSILPNEVKSQ